MKLAILGSCVTRDAVPYLPPHELVLYAARTSFVSLMAQPINVQERQLLIDQNFNRRMVHWDMTKAFWQKLADAKPDVILLDLIDERFDLWRKGDQIVTRSNYLQDSKTTEANLLKDFKKMLRRADTTHALWRQSCKQAMARIQEICPNVIIHRAMWAERFWIDGVVQTFEESERKIAQDVNAWLGPYYDHLHASAPGSHVVSMPEELCVSNFAHKWGRDFFHYGDDYYERLGQEIGALMARIGPATPTPAQPSGAVSA